MEGHIKEVSCVCLTIIKNYKKFLQQRSDCLFVLYDNLVTSCAVDDCWPNLSSVVVRWLRNHFTFPVVIIFAFVLTWVVLPSSLLAGVFVHWRRTTLATATRAYVATSCDAHEEERLYVPGTLLSAAV